MTSCALWRVLPVCLALSACGLRPELPSERRISVGEVVERVQCELAEALKPHYGGHPWLAEWAAGYTLTLKGEDEGSLTPSSDFVDFLAHGTHTLGLSVGATRTANRTATLDFSIYLSQLKNYRCGLPPIPDLPARYFADGTGIREWLDRIMEALDRKDMVQVPDKFGQTLEFVIRHSAGVTPAWSFVHYKPRSGAALSRKDTHTLAIVFVRPRGSTGVSSRSDFWSPGNTLSPVDMDTQDRLDRAKDQLQLRSLPLIRQE